MVITEYIIDVASRSDVIRLIPLGDIHAGTKNCDEEKFIGVCEYIRKTPNCYWLGMGDYIEAINFSDKRFDPSNVADWGINHLDNLVKTQLKWVLKYLSPIKHRCISLVSGNHEDTIRRHYHVDVTDYLATELETQNLSYVCMVRLLFRRKTKDTIGVTSIIIYASHGFGAGRFLGGKINNLINIAKDFEADIYLVGHCFSQDTQILTRNGWKNYNEIDIGMEVLTFNKETEVAQWQPIQNIFVYNDKFKTMLECKGRAMDLCITDNHSILYRNSAVLRNGKKGNWRLNPAKRVSNMGQVDIPTSGFSGYKEYNIKDDEIRLIGWLISEGHFRDNGATQLFQRWDNKQQIEQILKNLSITYSIYRRKHAGRKFNDPRTNKEYSTRQDSATFYITVREAQKKILPIIKSKQFPPFVEFFSDRQFGLLLDALMAGDGHWEKHGQCGCYYAKSKQLLDRLQMLCVSHGWRAWIKYRKENYELRICKRVYTTIAKQHENWRIISATPIVWCVSVANGTVMVRRNGKAVFCGNTHDKVAVDKDRLFVTAKGDPRLVCKKQIFALTGSFYKTYTDGTQGYAEKKGYPPAPTGVVKIRIEPFNVEQVDGKSISSPAHLHISE